MTSLTVGAALAVLATAGAQESSRFEAWRYNAGERTSRAISALEHGQAEEAVDQLDTAARLEETNALTLFNSGTARLIAGREDALARLEQAAAAAAGDLLAPAHYNVGNARLAAGNAAAAIEAFKQTLRIEPGHADAKFNLEIARRLLEQQQQQQREQQQPQDQAPEEGEDSGASDQPSERSEEQPPPQQQSPGEEDGQDDQLSRSQSEAEPPAASDENEISPGREALPGFEQQEDMTAEQAAAILEAVENLERQQREEKAAERARRRAKSGKDW